ncbi:MAG: repair protein SbcC/Rad50, partial [Actinomycetota bacterium]|nr:repair protein SbcC/Rad50 [Actinomycetota bacterium]
MRPRKLSLSGFGSFRDRTDIDFDGIDYFALVGPTGHGKSTIIDAIGFALYGRVPRYDDARVVNQVVSLGAQETRVELEFSVGDATYRVTRVVKLRNGKPKQEGRLERVLADGTTESMAGQVGEMRTAIEDLLHLPFGHFTKCVALPQGEFQRFLHDKPSDRRAVLVQLLNLDLYEQLGQRARELAGARKAEADAGEQRLEELSGATADVETVAVTRHEALVALHAAITDAVPLDLALGQRAERAQVDCERATQLLRALTAVRVPEEAAALGDEIEAAKRQVATRLDALDVAGAVRAEAEKIANDYEPELLAKLLDAHTAIATERGALAADETALAAHSKTDQRANAAAKKAQAQLDAAEQRLHNVRVLHNAHALVTELHVGEPCPVCAQKVRALPTVEPLDDLTEAKAELDGAKQLAKQAEVAVKEAAKAHAAAAGTVEQRRAAIDKLASLVTEHPDAEAVQATLTAARGAQQAAAGAIKHEREAIDAERVARSHLDQVVKRLDVVERTYTAQRDPLVALDPPAKAGNDDVGSWHDLAAWAAAQLDVQRDAAADAAAAVDATNRERHDLVAALRERAAGLDVRAVTLPDLQQTVVRAETQAEHAVARIAEQRAQADTLRAQVKERREQQHVAAELGKLLKSDQFIDWLVIEALTTLVRSASTLLMSLSNGAYALRLDDDNEFVVVDHANADETRSVRTLSGGETFQTALALALALSDQLSSLAADGAPRLEAIFLDEGFGTLDPESLDVVASTIETLGTTGRMVGIV